MCEEMSPSMARRANQSLMEADMRAKLPRISCPTLVLHREAASLASRRGIRNFALSMSHDGDCAAAIVVALRDTIQRPER